MGSYIVNGNRIKHSRTQSGFSDAGGRRTTKCTTEKYIRFSRPLHGFTLVELLVVIAIIGILVALLLPAVQAAREAARRSQCSNNMRQIALAMQLFHDSKGHQPQYHAAIREDPKQYAYTDPGPVWSVLILPYMEEQAIYDMFDKTVRMKARVNILPAQQVIDIFICPSAESASNPVFNDRTDLGDTNPKSSLGLYYPVSMGPTEPDQCRFCEPGQTGDPPVFCCQGDGYGTPGDSSVGMFGRSDKVRYFKQVTDGTSHTFLVGEALPEQCIYQSLYAPNFSLAGTSIPLNNFDFDACESPGPDCHQIACGFKSAHPGGAHFALVDGSVQFIPEAIDYRLYNQLGTRAGEEPVSLP